MSVILEDRGATVLVQQDDGTQVELTKESLDRVDPSFLGGGGPTSFIPPEQELREPELPPVAQSQPVAPAAAQVPATTVAPVTPVAAQEPEQIAGVPSGLSRLTPEQQLDASAELAASGARDQLEAKRIGVKAARERSAGEIKVLGDEEKRNRELDRRDEELFAAHEERVTKLMGTIEADVERITAGVDQNRVWRDMGTGRQILSIVAASVTGLGQALKGRGGDPNPVLSMINARIDRDVKLQLADRDRLAAGVKIKTGLLGQLRHNYTTSQGRLEAARAASERTVANQFLQMASRSKVPAAQQALAETAGALKIQAADRLQGIARFEVGREDQERRFQAGLRSQAAGRAAANRRAEAALTFQAEQAALDRAHDLEKIELRFAGQSEAAKQKALKEAGLAPGRPVMSTINFGKQHGFLPSNLSDGEIKKFDETRVELGETAKLLKELILKSKALGRKYKGPAQGFVESAEGREVQRLYAEYLRAKVRAFSGVTSRPDERKDIEDSLPIETFTNSIIGGDVDELWQGELGMIANRSGAWYAVKGQGQLDPNTIINEIMTQGSAATRSSSVGQLERGASTSIGPETALEQLAGLADQLDDNPTVIQRGGRFRDAVGAASQLIEAQGNKLHKQELRKLRARMARAISAARPTAFEVGIEGSPVFGGDTLPKQDLDRIFAPLEPLGQEPPR